ncbi:MAG: energy-coupled thiamine transporter ThiT [Clostridia bacterium]|nr:energy-coupled thiamine transporter ThiT [Clostridia bacterium]
MYESLTHTQFWLLISFFIVVGVFSILSIILTLNNKSKQTKLVNFCGIIAGVGLLIALLIVSLVDKNYVGYIAVSDFWHEFGLYILAAAILVILVLLYFLCGKKKETDTTKEISFAAITLALSFGLAYVKLFALPQGGSVTLLSLLPIMIFSYSYGIRKGMTLGFIFGFLMFIQEPWFCHPVQFLLDYPFAFASIGLAGIFHEFKLLEKKPIKTIKAETTDSTENAEETENQNVNDGNTVTIEKKSGFTFEHAVQFLLGGILAVILRYVCHIISGIFVFGSGDPTMYSAVAWSFLYNSFAIVDMSFNLIAGCALLSSNQMVKLILSASKPRKQKIN